MKDGPFGSRISPRLVHDSLTAVSARIALAALGFAGVFLATRLLEPADYGDLALLLAVVTVLYALAASWSAAPMYTLAAEECAGTGTLSLTSTARLLLILVAFVPIALASLLTLTLLAPGGIPQVFILSALVTAVASIWCEHVATLMEAGGRYRQAAVVQLLRPGVYVVLLVALLVARHATRVTMVLLILMVSWGVASAVSVAIAARSGLFVPLRTTRPTIVRVWHASWPLVLFSMSQLVFGTVDVFLLRAFTDSDSVGHYGLAYQCFSMGVVLCSALPALVTPRLTVAQVGGSDPLHRYLRAVDRGVLPVLGVLLAVLTALVPVLVPLFFGARFEAASVPLVVLCLALFLQFVAGWVGPILLVRSQTRVIATVALVAVLANVLLDLILLGLFHFGVVAPAVATTVASLCTAAAYLRHASKLSGASVANAVPTMGMVVLALISTLLLPAGWSMLLTASEILVLLAVMRRAGQWESFRIELPT